MTWFRLLLCSLLFFRRSAGAVLAATAIAAAVLTGALMVGDSVRHSLRALAIKRLGPVDHALTAGGFFPAVLARRISHQPGFAGRFRRCAAAIIVRGGASDESESRRTAGVQIMAADAWIDVPPGQCIINGELADRLGIDAPGRTVLLSVPLADDVPRDSTLARRAAEDVTSGMRLTVMRIARQPGMESMFSLAGGQRVAPVVWANLPELQNAVGQDGRANVLLVESRPEGASADASAHLKQLLKGAATLEDYGLSVSAGNDGREIVINARSTYIPPAVEAAAERAAAGQFPLRKVSVYLINNVVRLARPAGTADAASATMPATRPEGQTVIHYAVAAGISSLEEGALGPDEIALNEWTARALAARVGDRIRLDYYVRRADGELVEVRSDRPGVGMVFTVSRILPMKGLGADRTLTPLYRGITDADRLRAWQPPAGLVIRRELITDADEHYWALYKAAPKIFLNLHTAQRLWGGVFGSLNSIRVPAERAVAFQQALLRHIDADALGMTFRPVRLQQLQAAAGSTDFSVLFLAFSFFLMCSAVLLVAMVFRLNVEQRSRQMGLLSALGFAPGAVMGLAWVEGFILAAAGAAAGALLGVAYTGAVIAALRSPRWWNAAIGTSELRLHISVVTLALGMLASTAVAMLAITWAVRAVRRLEPGALLAGAWGRPLPGAGSSRRRATMRAGAAAATGGAVMLLLGVLSIMSAEAAFMAGGGLLLLGCLLVLADRLMPARRRGAVAVSVVHLAALSARRNHARSVAAVSLIALASFVLVTVSSMRQQPPADTRNRASGTGGFQLILEADIPLGGDLNTSSGRQLVGLRIDPSLSAVLDRARFVSMRRWAGEDISCLNLSRPRSPTVLAVPPAMIERGGFAPRGNPLAVLLPAASDDQDIPVVADAETATYILKLSVGDTFVITDQLGRERRLKLAATLHHSIFQSELLMSEADFVRLFPHQSGFGTVLIEAPDADVPALAAMLPRELAAFSVSVETTSSRLARYQQVANTYLSTFHTLGLLGLLLGTLGLAAMLLRNMAERRGEMSLLSAIGFSRTRRLSLAIAENAVLLGLGLGVGVLCALVAVAPAVVSAARPVNWTSAAVTVLSVLAAGLCAVALAAWRAGERTTPADLRAE